MAILADADTRVLVQGITGRQAHLNARYMSAYGTKIVAGVTPGKGGFLLDGTIPVYDTVAQALERHPEINTSLVYVPPRAVAAAATEAIRARIRLVVITTERCPQQDVMAVIARARGAGTRVVGPNSIGIITPGRCVLGLIGGRIEIANLAFRPGRIGVVSRSGGQTTTVCHYLTRAGFGQSTALGIGGDPFNGTSMKDALELFARDSETDAVVAFGEVGTRMEEEAAEWVASGKFRKPLVCYVAGRYVEEGVRYGHAGALIAQGIGRVDDKLRALRRAGATVLEHLDELAPRLREVLE